MQHLEEAITVRPCPGDWQMAHTDLWRRASFDRSLMGRNFEDVTLHASWLSAGATVCVHEAWHVTHISHSHSFVAVTNGTKVQTRARSNHGRAWRLNASARRIEWAPKGCPRGQVCDGGRRLEDGPSLHASALLTPRDVQRCCASHAVSKIGVLGDSQGARYALALTKLLAPDGCRVLKKEHLGANLTHGVALRSRGISGTRCKYQRCGARPDPNYYGVNDTVVHYRDCMDCFSTLFGCGEAEVEYLAHEHVLDTELTTQRDKWSHSCETHPGIANARPCHHATNTQQFYFVEYWGKVVPWPQVVVVFAVWVHEISRKPLAIFRADVRWFFSTLLALKPAATKVVYVESPGVVPERVAERFRGMTTNTRIAEYNGVAREEIAALGARDDLLSVGGVFALSAAAANLYEADGVHFQRASTWYGGVASAALRKVCGSGSL